MDRHRRFPGEDDPRAYLLPWSEQDAKRLENGERELEENGGEMRVELRSWEDVSRDSSEDDGGVHAWWQSLETRPIIDMYPVPQEPEPKKPRPESTRPAPRGAWGPFN